MMVALAPLLSCLDVRSAPIPGVARGGISLPGSVASGPFQEVVLFGFDNRAFPFQNNVQTHLITGKNGRIVLPPGPPGAHDEAILYYGSVIRIGDTLHLWYNGNYGPPRKTMLEGFEMANTVLCYATSRDGVNWVKPKLGLVEYSGSKDNNIVDLPVPNLWSTGAILHEPEDPDPRRRFKIAYAVEDKRDLKSKFNVAFSSDGLRWHPSPKNPVGPFLEMQGITKHQGLYYVNGQATFTAHGEATVRRLVTFVSADFETWSPCGALGLDRGPRLTGPPTEDDRNQYEEIHLGAALWNRGNVILGIYGQWHGHPTGDRGLTTIDLGLALTHDALHFHEPIPDFRIIVAREQAGRPAGVGPALQQGQGMENLGDETLYWYSLWRGNKGSGVRLITWPRDRLGALRPFAPDGAQAVSTPIQAAASGARVYVNASGLGAHTRLRLELVDHGFHSLPGFSGVDAAELSTDGLRAPVAWKGGQNLPVGRAVRIVIHFEGVRPEDARLHAVYISQDGA